MTKHDRKPAKAGGKPVEALVRRTRAFGNDDKAARESQRRASAYGRARGNP